MARVVPAEMVPVAEPNFSGEPLVDAGVKNSNAPVPLFHLSAWLACPAPGVLGSFSAPTGETRDAPSTHRVPVQMNTASSAKARTRSEVPSWRRTVRVFA